MTVLIAGPQDLGEINGLRDAVEDRGENAVVWDITDWPGEEPLNYAVSDEACVVGSEVPIDELRSAYLMSSAMFRPVLPYFRDSMEENWFGGWNQLKEYRAFFGGLTRVLEHEGVEVLNPMNSYRMHHVKAWQLTAYRDAGVTVPDTIFSNSPERVKAFYDDHDRVVYKPVSSGGNARELTAERIEDGLLKKLRTAPAQFQEYVEGDDLRVYVLDGEVVGAAQYVGEGVDVTAEKPEAKPVEPSQELRDAAVTATDVSGLTFASLDVVRRDDEPPVVLEVNKAPRFYYAHENGWGDIVGRLAEYLVEA